MEIDYYSLGQLTSNYNELVDTVTNFGTSKIIFSIFDTISDNGISSWIVKYPNILSNEPLIKGKCSFMVDYWRVSDAPVFSKIIVNPTWKQILLAVDELLKQGDNDGVYLEGIAFKEKIGDCLIYECIIGS